MGAFRTFLTSRTGIIAGILILFALSKGYSQSCEVTLRNDTLIDANNLLVDIYVRSTSGTFYYSSGQYKITFNKASILNGGIITGSIVPGFSDLTNSAQIPTIVNATASTYWRIITELPASSQATSSQISSTGFGTRICRVQLTNNQPFGEYRADNQVVTTTPYETAVFHTEPDGTAAAATLTVINTNLINPVLNGALTVYNVTGGTTEPATIDVSGSQSDGVVYTLYRNGTEVSTLTGDGSSLSFTGQPAGTYTVRAHRSGTYQEQDMSGTVTVSAACTGVTIASQPSGSTICAGGATSMVVGVAGESPYTYQWEYGNGSTWVSVTDGTPAGAIYTGANSSTLNITGISAAGSFDFRCYVTNCGSLSNATSGTATLIVNSVPSITGTTPGSSCGPGTVTLAATASAGTINWYAASTGGTSLGTGTTITTPSLSATTTYYVDATSNGCTTATRTAVTATINTISTITDITLGSNCGPGTVTLGATASAGTINWYSASTGGTSLGSGPSFTTPSLSATTTYYVDATSNGCTTATRTAVTATINTIPTITGTTPGSRCGPGTITLGATASAGTINWYAASTGGTSLGTGTNFTTPSLSATTTYYVDATSNGCTTATRTAITATINTVPEITGTTPGSRCGPGTVILGATASVGSVNWYAASTGGTSLGTGVSFTTPSISATTTYYADAINGGCTTTSRTAVIATINPLPVVDAGLNQTIPFGTSTSLNATVTGTGLSYSWTPSASLVDATIVDPTTVNLNTTTTFTLTATTSAGCAASDQVTVTVSGSELAASASATPSTVCAGTSVQLAANATGGSGTYSYSWTSSPGTFTSSSATPTVTPAVTTVYTVVVNDGFNFTSSSVTVTVNAVPLTSSITGNSTPVCSSAGNVYSVTATAGSTYAWTVPAGSTIISGLGTNSITVSFGTTNGNISVVETNASGCPGSPRNLYVTLLGCDLDADFTAIPRIVCAGIPVQFSNTSLGTSGNTSFQWSFGSGAVPVEATGAGPHNVTYSTGGLKTVSLTITEGATNTETKTDYITVNPLPGAAGTITGTASVCQGQSGVLYSVPSITGAISYSWTYSGTGATITGTTNNVSISFATNATSGTLAVRGVNSCGNGTLSAGFSINLNTLPTAPIVVAITQATCSVSTGSVALSGLPATGTWTLTRTPGGATQTGTGATYTVPGLPEGTHTFTVTNANGCISPSSTAVVINAPPAVPTAPVMGTVTQPTCAVTTGSVGISGLPPTGTWTLTRNPGGNTVTGTGTTYTLSGIPAGTYTYTVTNVSGCVSPASASITVNEPLPVPAVPVHSVNCDGGFNHAIITVASPTGTGYEYRLNSGTWQTSNIFNDVLNGSHTITVRNSSGCTTTGEPFSVNCGCVNPPLLTLGATSGSTCGLAAVTVSGNSFGGSATSVTITENGGGTVTPLTSATSPFAFTYTPTAADAGRTVIITVTTNNPLGSPCAAASATYTLTVNALPVAPVPGTVTHPTCAVPTGSVVLNSLPASGDWTVTRTPGGQTTTGSGTSTTITGLTPGTYNFTVTNANGCVSAASSNVVINAQPDTPTAPVTGVITQPTCALSTGSVALSGLPATGTWTLTRIPGNVTISGTGTTRTVTAIPPGAYTFTVANAAGCVSPASAEFVINVQPVTPNAPVIGTITHPTCELATGSTVLENMPESGEWTLIRYPGGSTSTGTGSSATISSLPAGTYNFAVRNADGCTSGVSANAVINAQPPTPNAPVVGTITQPTFVVGTGSVVLTGLPSSGTWTLIRYPDGFTSQGTGTTRTVAGLEPGTYTFAVTNSVGCTSLPTGDVVINARPGAPVVVINNPPTICENETTDLTAPAVTAGSDANLTFSYWTNEAATEAYGTPQAATAGTYYIMGTSTAGYYTIKPVVVTADEIPVANAGEDQVLKYLFGAILNAEIPEIGTGFWSLVSGTGDLFNSAAPITAVSGLSIGANVFSWTVTNGACDPVSDEVTVTVNDLLIPTLITPNDDGYNDSFELLGIETLGRTEIVIFDRRGLKVWESRSYENDWDGRDYNGNLLPEDTYFWVIRADNGVSKSGYIVIRR